MNIDKVKQALNCCANNQCDICAYADTDKGSCFNTLMQDACTAIEEQEERIAIMQESMEALEKRCNALEALEKRCDVLEAVEPTLIYEGRNKNYNYYVCPRCDNEVVYEQSYCSECGVRFRWEGR